MEVNKEGGEILRLVKERNVNELNKFERIPARMVICSLKNDLEDLDYFMSWLSKWCTYLPGAGSYHFENIIDNRTFDIYKKYDFGPCNLFDDIITDSQWDYVLEIGYVTQEQYDNRSA